MKVWAVLGGGGWVGSHLLRHLLLHEPEVRIVVVGRSPERAPALLLHRGIDDARYEYHQIHLVSETDRLLSMLDDIRPEVIVNLAAQGEEAASWAQAWRYFETNTVALARIVEAIAEAGWLRRWVQIGSASVYGSGKDASSEGARLAPATPYAVSKAAADLYLQAVQAVKSFPATILRPPGLYGPGQQVYRVIPRAILCALLGRRLPLHGGGEAKKFYLHVEDLCRVIHRAGETGQPGRVYNVGPTEGVSIRAVVDMIGHKTGVRFDELVDLAPSRGKQDTQASLDSARARLELGWEPTISLSRGLDDMIAWMRPRLDRLQREPSEFIFQV